MPELLFHERRNFWTGCASALTSTLAMRFGGQGELVARIRANQGWCFIAQLPTLCERRYIRPEVRFGGLAELVARIRTDVGLASAALDTPTHADLRRHEFLA